MQVLGLPDSLAGMRCYTEHLQLCEEADPKRREALAKHYCRGWFIGSKEEKESLSKDLNEQHPDVVWSGEGLKDLNEIHWEELVKSALAAVGKTSEDISTSQKGASWKVEIAKELRRCTTAGNPWIAKRLNMGHPSRVTNLIKEV